MSAGRLLFSAATTNEEDACSSDPYAALTEEVSHHDADEAFTHVYYVMVFVSSLWFVGKVFAKVGMPPLVGEIITGIIMGPNLLNVVGTHGSEFLIVIGEIGLIMLVVEAGIDVDIGMLKLIGPRGLGVAVLGSVVPLLMGFAIAMALFGESVQSAIAIGSCFAPTSMGIALNVLKAAHILNTPTGQLIIAAAILDDVIALIILSELGAMKHPTVKNIVLPLVISPVLIIVVGYLSIRLIPKLIKQIMSKIPAQHHENSILTLLFVSTFVLIPACHFVGSSHLLGAFLSGLMFCTDHTIHHVWSHQIKRILQWMLRIFFACTIGFAIPIKEFASGKVIYSGFTYFVCFLGKFITGIFGRPLTKKEFLTIGFSMSAWGEFAFIIATASFEEGTIGKESFSAVLLAVLLSVIISPYCLRTTLIFYEKRAQKQMEKNLEKYGDDNQHPVYFAINTKAMGQWGHQDKILHLIFTLQLEIIDFRSWHAPEFNHSHHLPLTKESFYVMDQTLVLLPSKHLKSEQKEKLKLRVKEIRHALKEVLGDNAIVNIKRWLPGIVQEEDTLDKKDAVFGEHVLKTQKRASYCRREAFRQAHSIMSSFDISGEDRISPAMLGVGSLSSGQTGLGLPVQPTPIQSTRSVPNDTNRKRATLPVNMAEPVLRSKLRRQLSDPDTFHSGAGHGGKTKGLGALPVTNRMINIHDHFRKRTFQDLHNYDQNQPEPAVVDNQHSDDSTSYIYGDEDAEHHKLPLYEPPQAYAVPASLEMHQATHLQQPTAIIREETGTPSHHTSNGQDGKDINGEEMDEDSDSDVEQDHEEQGKQRHHTMITVTSFDHTHPITVSAENTPNPHSSVLMNGTEGDMFSESKASLKSQSSPALQP